MDCSKNGRLTPPRDRVKPLVGLHSCFGDILLGFEWNLGFGRYSAVVTNTLASRSSPMNDRPQPSRAVDWCILYQGVYVSLFFFSWLRSGVLLREYSPGVCACVRACDFHHGDHYLKFRQGG